MIKNVYILLFSLLAIPLFSFGQNPGSLDLSFNQTGIVNFTYQGRETSFLKIKLQPDGKILAVGYTTDSTGYPPLALIARFNADGTPDTDFADDGFFILEPNSQWGYSIGTDIFLMDNGSIQVVADEAWSNYFLFFRLKINGDLDLTYGQNGMVRTGFQFDTYSPVPRKMIVQPDGKMVVVGSYIDYISGQGDVSRGLVVRFNPDGTFDQTFGGTGYMKIIPSAENKTVHINGGAVLPDGKILVGCGIGSTQYDAVWQVNRYLPNGELDASFGTGGVVNYQVGTQFWEAINDILVYPDGKFIAAGYGQKLPGFHFTMVRFLPNGSVDNSFGLGGKSQVTFDCCYSDIFDLTFQNDGKIVACGYSSEDNDLLNFSLARFKANGLVDQEFGDEGKVVLTFNHQGSSQRALSVLIQPDGKILAAGYTDTLGYAVSGVIVRLHASSMVNTYMPEKIDVELQAGPNPISGNQLWLTYSLDQSAEVSMTLTDLSGRRVIHFVQGETRSEGSHRELFVIPENLIPGYYQLTLSTKAGSQSVGIVKPAE